VALLRRMQHMEQHMGLGVCPGEQHSVCSRCAEVAGAVEVPLSLGVLGTGIDNGTRCLPPTG
jgi:hypothetical protein